MYSGDNSEYLPNGDTTVSNTTGGPVALEALYPIYLSALKIFSDPSDSQTPVNTKAAIGSSSSFAYKSLDGLGAPITEMTDADTPLAADMVKGATNWNGTIAVVPSDIHGTDGILLLWADGHVSWQKAVQSGSNMVITLPGGGLAGLLNNTNHRS
jgi:hypothetical protein